MSIMVVMVAGTGTGSWENKQEEGKSFSPSRPAPVTYFLHKAASFHNLPSGPPAGDQCPNPWAYGGKFI